MLITNELRIEVMKKKIDAMMKKESADRYIQVLHNIIEWEKEHPKDSIDGKWGWQMDDIEGLNGGLLNQLLQEGVITQGYYSNQYHHYALADSYDIVEVALDEVEGEREAVALTGSKKKEESPIITQEDVENFESILREHDAIDYWHKFIAPTVCGYERVKKAILIQLASPDDTKNSRGRIHILLEGEPGTGKSMFREWVTYEMGAEYASMRTTGAGLTRDMKTGEPGAIDRANNSVWKMLTLEELRDWDRDQLEMMKESMSEGRYPLKGAGISELVEANIRVLACTNDIESKKFSQQFLDRFDLIVHFDRPTKEQANPIIDKVVDDFMVNEDTSTEIMQLKKYLWWVKQYYPDFPKSARDKMKILIKIYKDSKYEDGKKVNIRTDIGGILRFAYTIARLNHRPVKPLEDCMKAIEIVDPKFNKLKLEGISTVYRKIIESRKV